MSGSAGSRQDRDDGVLCIEAKEAFARCGSAEELCRIAHIHLDRCFPDASACIYLADESGTRFAAPQVCECQRNALPEFRHYECWAICRGTAHSAGNISDGSPCGHVKGSDDPLWHYLCLPMYSGSRVIGLLHIEHAPRKREKAPEGEAFSTAAGLRLLLGFADEIASALAGLHAAGA